MIPLKGVMAAARRGKTCLDEKSFKQGWGLFADRMNDRVTTTGPLAVSVDACAAPYLNNTFDIESG